LNSLRAIAAAEKKQGQAHVPGKSNGTPKKKAPVPAKVAPKGKTGPAIPVKKVTPPGPGHTKVPNPAPTHK
jgi:hypothetical protein